MPLRNLLILSLFLIFSIPLEAQLSRKERKIVSAVDARNEEYLELLRQAVSINSGTMNFDGVRKVGELFSKKLKALGFETQLTSGVNYNRAGHLVATYGSGKGKRILLIGHLDTVFEPDSPFQEYKMLNDSIMNGPGVADMKGGDVIIILAMQALRDAGLLKDLSIEIIMTGDEEKSGDPLELSKKDLIDAADRADVALGFEDADGDPKTIVVARRGSVGWKLQVTGNAAHSSQIFTDQVGTGAIYEASRILNEFYLQLSGEQDLTFNPGVILGGTSVDPASDGGRAFGKSNVVAQEVLVRGDIRAITPQQLDKAEKIMQGIVSKNYPGTKATLTFEKDGYPPLAGTEGNMSLLKMYDAASRDLGFGGVDPVNPRNAGAADISFTAGHAEMAIDGLGLSGADDHTVQETGNLNKLSVQAKRAALLIYRLSGK